MRLLSGPVFAVVAALAVAACSSSGGGTKTKSGSLEVRPVIMPAEHATNGGANPFASLHVPATEAGYSSLSPTQRTALLNALRHVDCAHPPAFANSSVRVACGSGSYAYLLGAPLFTADNVTSAVPQAPDPNVSFQWNIQLMLDSTGADRVYRWTSEHHAGDPDGEFGAEQSTAKPPCGPGALTPCSDFLAYISNGVVVSVPPTFIPFRSAVTLSGAFNRESATKLAHKITG